MTIYILSISILLRLDIPPTYLRIINYRQLEKREKKKNSPMECSPENWRSQRKQTQLLGEQERGCTESNLSIMTEPGALEL